MKRLSTQIAVRFAGTVLAAVVQAATYVVLARTLGADGFGAFGAMFAIGALVYVLTGFGFTALALRLDADNDADVVRATLVTVRVAVMGVIALLLLVSAVALTVPEAATVMAVSFVVIDGVTDLCQAILAGARRIRRATALLLAQRVAVLIAAWCVSTTGALWPFAMVAFAVVAANVLLAARRRPRLQKVPSLIVASRGYWKANVASSVSQLEVPAIVLCGGAAMAGMYAAGARAANPVNLVGQAILQLTTPELAVSGDAKRWHLFAMVRRATMWIMLAGALVAVPLGIAGSWVLGPGFEAAWVIIAGFVLAGTIMGANQAHQALLLAVGQPHVAARCVAIGASMGVVAAGLLSLTAELPWLAVVPVLAQATMHGLFRRAVWRYASPR